MYSKFMIFSKVILFATRDTKDSRGSAQRSLTKKIGERLDRWSKWQFGKLWADAKKQVENSRPSGSNQKKGKGGGKNQRSSRPQKRKGECTQTQINAERAKDLTQVGQYLRAFQYLGSIGIAKNNEDSPKELKDKPPQNINDEEFQRSVFSAPLSFTPSQVLAALKSFKRGSAAALDGMRAEHLRGIVGKAGAGSSRVTLATISKVVNSMAAGGTPNHHEPFMAFLRRMVP